VPLQVTPQGQTLSDDFKAAAKARDYAKAFDHLKGLNVMDALVSCLDLIDADHATFEELIAQASANERPQFSVRLVANGFIPQARFEGLREEADYETARLFILRVRTEKSRVVKALWPSAAAAAASRRFYPEIARRYGDKRERICRIAQGHAGLGPNEPRQVALFSVGGRYDYTIAAAGTHPKGTTCILFARGVLHAAGCNVVWDGMSELANVPLGLFANLATDKFGYVTASEFDKGKRPQRGDIFHIRGGNYRDKDGKLTQTDSTHVGVIVEAEANGQIWHTIEGGAGDHVTKVNTRQLVSSGGSSYGKWAFKGDDQATSAGVRPLQGWYDVDKIDLLKWM
jgi:hypothetical protein